MTRSPFACSPRDPILPEQGALPGYRLRLGARFDTQDAASAKPQAEQTGSVDRRRSLVAPATATATTAATEAPAAATAATAALGPRPCLVDGQGAAVHLLAVEGSDGRLRLLLTAHLHEAEALGAARVAVL